MWCVLMKKNSSQEFNLPPTESIQIARVPKIPLVCPYCGGEITPVIEWDNYIFIENFRDFVTGEYKALYKLEEVLSG